MKQIIKCFLFFYFMGASAQNVNIEGRVTDDSGVPIENVNVITTRKGAKVGVISDAIGNYKISCEAGSSISFSMVGFDTKVIVVDRSQTIDVVLKSNKKKLDEVTISTQKQRNLVELSSERLQAKPLDMPTSTSRVSASLVERQMILKPSEVFMNVAGIYQFNQGHGGTGETVGARGLSLRYQGYMFRDGLRTGANQAGATMEMQNFESIDVHKGASAINFGYTSIGAVINYVTKKPTFSNKGTASMRVGQYNFFKPSVDLDFKVSEKLGVRFVGSYENSESFRESVKSQRASGYLVSKYLINHDSSLSFNVDYLWDKTPRDFGVPVFKTRVQKVGSSDNVQTEGVQKLWDNLDRTRFLGSKFNDRVTHQWSSNANYQLNLFKEKGVLRDWKALVTLGLSQSSNAYQQTGSGFRNKYKLLPDGDVEITRSFEKGKVEDQFLSGIANLNGKIQIMDNVFNQVSISADYDGRTNTTYGYSTLTNFDKITLKSSEGEKGKST